MVKYRANARKVYGETDDTSDTSLSLSGSKQSIKHDASSQLCPCTTTATQPRLNCRGLAWNLKQFASGEGRNRDKSNDFFSARAKRENIGGNLSAE